MAILKPVKKQLDLENMQNMQYNFDAVNKQADSLQGQIDSISAADSNAQIGIYSLTADGTNDYTATYEGLTYFNGLKVSLSIPHGQENTGAATLNLNSIGAKNIKYYDAEGNKQPLVNNELIGRVLLEYDGTDFVVLSTHKFALQQELDEHKADDTSAHGINTKVSKNGDTMTGRLDIANNTVFPLLERYSFGADVAGTEYPKGISTIYVSDLSVTKYPILGHVLTIKQRIQDRTIQFLFDRIAPVVYVRTQSDAEGTWTNWAKLWNSANTIVDSNGFIKEA